MNELHRELSRLAATVGDDGTAERLSGRVGPMVAHIRRRRAARRTGMGVAAVGAVAAAVLVVPGLTDGTPAPAASWSLAPGVACGDPLPELPTAGPLDLVVGVHGTQPGGLELSQTVANGIATDVRLAENDSLAVLVVHEGDVVAVVADAGPVSGTMEPGSAVESSGGPVRLVTCQPGGAEDVLLDGSYEVFALLSDAQGASLGTSGPLPLEVDGVEVTMPTLTAAGTAIRRAAADAAARAQADADRQAAEDALAERHAAAEAAIAALLETGPAPGATFPACATSVPDPDPHALLAIDLGGPLRLPEGTDPVTVVAPLATTGGRTVLGNAGLGGETQLPLARLVLARDGVVVGASYLDPEDLTLLDLAPDRNGSVAALGRPTICSVDQTDAPGEALPPGTYQAYAVLEVMLKEVTEADGTATSRSDLITVVSPAAEMTIEPASP